MGDQAILQGLLVFLEQAYPNAELIIHSSNPDSYEEKGFKVKPTLYFWSTFEKKGFLIRIFRLSQLVLQYFFCLIRLRLPIGQTRLLDLLDDYRAADLIIFVGGGYLRTKSGLTQSLNLLIQLSMLAFAKIFTKNIIVAPMSFGPFARAWQEKISARFLKDVKLVSVREEISYQILKKYNIQNVIISADQAFNLDYIKVEPKDGSEFLLGFTVRNWLPDTEQQRLHKAIADAIFNFGRHIKITVQPIIQVNAPEYGDDDIFIANEIADALKKRGIAVNETIHLKNIEQALLVYGKIDLLIGMRMHSNILSIIQHTPFVAIAYEHKTPGMLKMLGLDQFCIDCEEVNQDNLLTLLNQVYTNRLSISNQIKDSITAIKAIEFDRWQKILI